MPTPTGAPAADRDGDDAIRQGAAVRELRSRAPPAAPPASGICRPRRRRRRRRTRPGRPTPNRRKAAARCAGVGSTQQGLFGGGPSGRAWAHLLRPRRLPRARTRECDRRAAVRDRGRLRRSRPSPSCPRPALRRRRPGPARSGVAGIGVARREDQDEPGLASERAHGRSRPPRADACVPVGRAAPAKGARVRTTSLSLPETIAEAAEELRMLSPRFGQSETLPGRPPLETT